MYTPNLLFSCLQYMKFYTQSNMQCRLSHEIPSQTRLCVTHRSSRQQQTEELWECDSELQNKKISSSSPKKSTKTICTSLSQRFSSWTSAEQLELCLMSDVFFQKLNNIFCCTLQLTV